MKKKARASLGLFPGGALCCLYADIALSSHMSGILIDATAADTEGSLGGDVPFDTSFEINHILNLPQKVFA